MLIEIENQGERLINFRKNRKDFQFDPNRIFTTKGLQQNLHKLNTQVTTTASNAVKAFSKFVLQQIPKSAVILVALHNNDDGEYSIDSYRPGGDYARDALRIHTNSKGDPDNFILTTSSKVFHHLKRSDLNVVFQNNARAKDDGVGFDATQTGRGIGLSNIYERSHFYNGTVDIKSSPGNGCTLIVTIPV